MTYVPETWVVVAWHTQHIHGTNDELVTYTGNPLFGWDAVTKNAQAWARRNGCLKLSPTTTFSNRSGTTNNSVTCRSYCSG